MTATAADVEIEPYAAEGYHRLSADRRRTLAGPEDDMWAAFADQAVPHALTLGGRLVGRFSVDAERQLHGFFVADAFEEMTTELVARVVEQLDLAAVITSTLDPVLLSLCLASGGRAESLALMYDHVATSEIEREVAVRLAGPADHAAAVAFSRAETGSPDAFGRPYLAQRIDLRELFLVEADGVIIASGECRGDTRTPGNAHLGFVVATAHRGQGLGSRLMHTLVQISHEQGLTPRCSTEPSNTAAQRAIRRAGFRHRHQVLRITWPAGGARH